MFGGEHARPHGGVNAFDLRHVQRAGRTTDQHGAGHFCGRQRLPATRDNRPGACRENLATLQQRLDLGMMLPLLEHLEGLEPRIAVAQTHDIAQRNAVVGQVVEKAATVHIIGQRPAHSVDDLAWLDAALRHLPQLLQPDAVVLWIMPFGQLVALDQLLGDGAARPFGQHGDLGAQVHARRVSIFLRTVLGHAHVAGAHTHNHVVFD